MEDALNDRMARPRKRGRPPKNQQQTARQEATTIVVPERVPAMICPACGRGMTPRTLTWRFVADTRVAVCQCTSCGKRYDWYPPMARPH